MGIRSPPCGRVFLKGPLPVTIGGPCVGLLCEEETEEDLEIARQVFAKRQVEVELQYTRSKATLAEKRGQV